MILWAIFGISLALFFAACFMVALDKTPVCFNGHKTHPYAYCKCGRAICGRCAERGEVWCWECEG